MLRDYLIKYCLKSMKKELRLRLFCLKKDMPKDIGVNSCFMQTKFVYGAVILSWTTNSNLCR